MNHDVNTGPTKARSHTHIHTYMHARIHFDLCACSFVSLRRKERRQQEKESECHVWPPEVMLLLVPIFLVSRWLPTLRAIFFFCFGAKNTCPDDSQVARGCSVNFWVVPISKSDTRLLLLTRRYGAIRIGVIAEIDIRYENYAEKVGLGECIVWPGGAATPLDYYATFFGKGEIGVYWCIYTTVSLI